MARKRTEAPQPVTPGGTEALAAANRELRKRNEELTAANEDLVNLFASASMAMVVLDHGLRIRRFTQPAEKILNILPSDVGRPIGEIRLNSELPSLDAMIAEAIATATTREREVQIHGHWYSLRVRPHRADDAQVDGALLALMDVDSMKRADQSVHESERRFEMLADTAPVLIWTSDLQGCQFVNRAYEEFVGASEADVRRQGQEAFVHPDERAAFAETYAQASRSRERFEMRVRFRRADGAWRWMKMVGVPRFNGGEFMGYVGCTFDITDMAEAEAALRDLDRGKNEFLAVLAHELRNPLSGVRNAARLLAEPNDRETVAQARAIIDRQSAHMVRMIDDLLDISRITYGKIRLQRQPVDLVAVARAAIASTAQQRENLGQALEVQLPEAPLIVEGDAVRLDQVFTNLLANASKFTRREGRVRLIVERAGNGRPEAVLRVRDNGVGIEPAMLGRIFDLFVQTDSPTEHSRTGIGLGLTLAKRLVDLHGGTIEAHSAGNALGSEFVVRLPLAEEGMAERPSATEVGEPPARRRVLIVEDNVDSGQSLRMLLAKSGHDVRLVEDGAAAFPAAVDFRPDLVVLDIGLPDLDGYAVARQLRDDARTRGAYIVAATGYGRDQDRAKSREAGIDEHMTKPLDVDVLMQRLARRRAG